MKALIRFVAIALFIFALSSHAITSTLERREPVILDLYRSLGSAMQNGPVVIAALGASLVVGIFFSKPSNLINDLWGRACLPMTVTLFGVLLTGNYLHPAQPTPQ